MEAEAKAAVVADAVVAAATVESLKEDTIEEGTTVSLTDADVAGVTTGALGLSQAEVWLSA